MNDVPPRTNTGERVLHSLPEALERLQATTGLSLKLNTRSIGKKHKAYRADGVLTVSNSERSTDLLVEAKRVLTTESATHLLTVLDAPREKFIFATERLSPATTRALRESNIQFVDLAGNLFLNLPSLYVFISATGGPRPPSLVKEQSPRLFMPSGLKVLFALLSEGLLLSAPYREIARRSGVALGSVDWTIKDLRNAGFLVDLGGKRRKLVRRQDLLDAWIHHYAIQLRPRLNTKQFTGPEAGWWMKSRVRDYGIVLGGEVGAAKLVGHLKPNQVVAYTAQFPSRFIAEHRLRPDPEGSIAFVDQFWNFPNRSNPDLAPPLLLYADLVGGDSRNAEAAKLIYAKYLAQS